MHRWHLLRWHGWQLALHKIWRSDDDRAMHDHIGDNVSVLLTGCYEELRSCPRCKQGEVSGHSALRIPLIPYFRRAETPHRLVLTKPVWTLWLRWPRRREWGFHCPSGWVHEKDYKGCE